MDYRSIIESRYNRENWQNLLYDIFRQKVQFWEQPQPVAVDESMARRAVYTGKITLPDGHVIAIYEVELSDSVVIERNRAGIRNLLCSSWRGMGCSGAFMFCFRQNEAVLRFSYVSESFAFTEEGALKMETTDTKRFTYLMGEGHRSRTAIEQFEKLKASSQTLKDLTKAFSVEALSDLFFDGYKKQYENIIEFATGKRMVKVANKWEERVTGEPCREIMQQFSQFPDTEKAVRDYVKKLMGRLVFIQFLQKKGWMGCSAGEAWNDGDREFVQTLFANSPYKDTFVDDVLEPLFNDINTKRPGDISGSANVGVNIKIPYLNGGLFEKDEYDNTAFPLPARFMKSMLDFFASYNFTIDENDPDDAEIGVDPEMLGRIFENLLEDNKDKGAFYTPKEIVQYMCRESLIAYLQTGIEDEETKAQIRTFVTTYDASPLSPDLAESIDQKLKDVKICDPAIGSGAFPMGLLRELYACRKAIEGIENDNAVKIKSHIIQNNIYGVDIEKGAVDIARLRFWLALIVDEKTPHALPNMDFKIMQGNSLLEQYKGVDLSKLAEQKKEIEGHVQLNFFDNMTDVQRKDLNELLSAYFSKQENKAQLREEIRQNVLGQLRESGIKSSIIAELENIDLHSNANFFLWHTWFVDVFQKGGFDIVIGNPPYKILTKNNTDNNLLSHYIQQFESIKKCSSKNLYTLFIEKAINNLSRDKAFLGYIVPEGLFITRSYIDCVSVMNRKGTTVQVVTFSDFVFENAVTGSLIFLYQKGFVNEMPKRFHFDEKYNLTEIQYTENKIIPKIRNQAESLKNIAEIFKGMVVGDRNNCIYSEQGENKHRFLLGKNISKWEINSCYWTTYDKLNIIGGTKRIEKHNHAPRILIRRTGDVLCCAYLEDVALTESTLYSCWSNKSNVDNKYMFALLNSKLLNYYNHEENITNQQGFPQILMTDLQELPIKCVDSIEQQPIISLVETILEKKRNGQPTEQEEREIDLLVYRLYCLTYDEVKIVDPETDITEEEYNIA